MKWLGRIKEAVVVLLRGFAVWRRADGSDEEKVTQAEAAEKVAEVIEDLGDNDEGK